MIKLQPTPRLFPLILILIGTSLLAIPAAFATAALFDTNSQAFDFEKPVGIVLLGISIAGFSLYAGYLLTAVYRRFNSYFWLFSLIYNLALSLCYLYFVMMGVSAMLTVKDMLIVLLNPLMLLPLWTVFVTIASGYYFKIAMNEKKDLY